MTEGVLFIPGPVVTPPRGGLCLPATWCSFNTRPYQRRKQTMDAPCQ